jgi:hypothetical protein
MEPVDKKIQANPMPLMQPNKRLQWQWARRVEALKPE